MLFNQVFTLRCIYFWRYSWLYSSWWSEAGKIRESVVYASMCVVGVLKFESMPVWLTCLFSCHDKSYPKRSGYPVVKADKMLCHGTVILQPAAAHHDKWDVQTPSSEAWFYLSPSVWQGGVCSNLKKWHCVAWFMCVGASVWKADQSQQQIRAADKCSMDDWLITFIGHVN